MRTPSDKIRETAKGYLRRHYYLQLKGHDGAMSPALYKGLIGVLLLFKIEIVVVAVLVGLGIGLDPQYWATHPDRVESTFRTLFQGHTNLYGHRFAFQFLVGMHVVTGIILSLVCIIPLVSIKGGKVHRAAGRAFVLVWLFHLVDGLGNGAQILITRGLAENGYMDMVNEGYSLYNIVQFCFIGSVVVDLLAGGLGAVQHKVRVPRLLRIILVGMPAMSLVFGLGLAIWGAHLLLFGLEEASPKAILYAFVYVVQCPAYGYLLWRNIAYWRTFPMSNYLQGWVMEHQRNLMFCVGVTLYTGMANVAMKYAPETSAGIFLTIDVGFFAWILLKDRTLRRRAARSRAALVLSGATRLTAAGSPPDLGNRDRELRWVFTLFDLDRDGAIQKDELMKVLEEDNFQLSSDEVSEIISCLDQNGDGEIDMSEFARFIAPWLFSVSTSAQEVAAAFRGFDADGDGTISLPELRSVLSRGEGGMSKAEIEEIVRLAGIRGSGSLDYREFAAMIGHP